ncbi:DIBOA-glucoside dioxygenase BX6-like [Panicum miliaceum]|uniref:DIBOA-glucoside dioxygenase BX6-like n=1 Tax=Panicum miliaceum TaxID=4540 RepID=A0A3L6SGV1_PANMI|nr:DIBOA-glucoside dioxygenase BX6-like [Panicum miliaceum]
MEDSDSDDRLSQLMAFDDTKAGVKGLVDAGIATVPPIFRHPPDPHAASATTTIPVVDLGRPDLGLLRAAAETVGFFQVVNHGVPAELLAETLAAVRRFNEEPAEARRPYYTRDPARRVSYHSNFDLFQSPAANWRDTLFLEMPAPPEEMPPPCRAVVPEYTRQLRRLGARLLELLSEALGLHVGYLERDAGCLDGMVLACHHYPPCPEPHLTMGTARHSDPSFLTVLLQDGVGGLQVLHGGRWADVPPLPGVLVVNVGDLLQLTSDDRFKSGEHRVVAMTPGAAATARVSVACFFRTTGAAASTRAYGPIAVATDDEEESPPPRYRSVTVAEFLGHYKDKGLDGRSALGRFRPN